jgi:hypothetical protein
VSQALASERVELKRVDQRILIFFCQTLVQEIDLCSQQTPTCKESPDNDV